MNKTILTLAVFVLGAILLTACAQQAAAQPLAVTATQLPAPTDTQTPASIAPDTGTVVPGVVGPPLTQITPETPTSVTTDPGGNKVVTRDFQGQTLNLAVGEGFLLKLGEEYTWDITISDQTVLSRVKNIAVIRGAQGVYDGLKPGTVTVSASGDPLCRQSKPACGMASIQIEFTVVVK
jgi:ABC-type transport system substrate-binding protein